MFFPVQSIGFLLAGLGIAALLIHKQGGSLYAAAGPAVFSGTFLFVAMMIVGLACMDFGLCFIAGKLKKRSAIVLLILSFILCLGMGYLSSKNFEKASLNWIAEAVNILAQLTFLLSVLILDKGGLKEMNLR